MNHVDQQWSASRLPSPRARFEIMVRLAEHCCANDSHQASDPAAAHDLSRLRHDWIVLAMMPRQQLHVRALGRLAEPLTRLDRIRQRFFD
jgi:hypothetical protein